jgi:hypothetical protein
MDCDWAQQNHLIGLIFAVLVLAHFSPDLVSLSQHIAIFQNFVYSMGCAFGKAATAGEFDLQPFLLQSLVKQRVFADLKYRIDMWPRSGVR